MLPLVSLHPCAESRWYGAPIEPVFQNCGCDGHKFVSRGVETWLRYLRVVADSCRIDLLRLPGDLRGGGIRGRGSQIPDILDSAGGAGGHRVAGKTDQCRAGDPAAAGRHRARLRAGYAIARIAAGTGAADGIAAADLLGERRHELARIQIQPATDHPAGGRLRDFHGVRGGGRDALSDRAAVERRLPARRHRCAAGCGGAAGDRPQARTATPNPCRPRGRGTGERRHRADPVSLRGGSDFDRNVFTAESGRRIRRHRRMRGVVRRRRGLAQPESAPPRSRSRRSR